MVPLKKLLKIFSFPIVVLLLHIVVLPIGIYQTYPSFDIPMHFLGGLSVAITYCLLLKFFQSEKYLGKTNKAVFFLFVISLVVFTAVLWEFFEFIITQLSSFNAQIGLEDTMLDLFMGLIGGICGYFLPIKRLKK